MAPKVSERDFQLAVMQLAKFQGWLTYHTFNSRHSEPGFPDLVMVRDGQLIFAELKVGKNKPTEAQKMWGDALRAVENRTDEGLAKIVEYHLWTLDDWPKIERTLERTKGR